jgi:hypothetical protein
MTSKSVADLIRTHRKSDARILDNTALAQQFDSLLKDGLDLIKALGQNIPPYVLTALHKLLPEAPPNFQALPNSEEMRAEFEQATQETLELIDALATEANLAQHTTTTLKNLIRNYPCPPFPDFCLCKIIKQDP